MAIVFLSVGRMALGQSRHPAPPRRSAPPNWTADVEDIFFADVRAKLVGERPDDARAGTQHSDPAAEGRRTDESAAAGFAWSTRIAAETIEDELKQLKNRVMQDVTTPGPFKGGGFRKCRDHFSFAAIMFAIAAEFDGPVRWKESAAGLRDRFARAGFNCKVGTDASYREARQRRANFEDLIRGDRVDAGPGSSNPDWTEVADAGPLMKRMERATQDRLSPWLSSRSEFRRQRERVVHEAQIVAAIAEVITREGYEYWDDDIYLEYARQLGASAARVDAAAEKGDYQRARQAAGEMSKACSQCHEDYRSM